MAIQLCCHLITPFTKERKCRQNVKVSTLLMPSTLSHLIVSQTVIPKMMYLFATKKELLGMKDTVGTAEILRASGKGLITSAALVSQASGLILFSRIICRGHLIMDMPLQIIIKLIRVLARTNHTKSFVMKHPVKA